MTSLTSALGRSIRPGTLTVAWASMVALMPAGVMVRSTSAVRATNGSPLGPKLRWASSRCRVVVPRVREKVSSAALIAMPATVMVRPVALMVTSWAGSATVGPKVAVKVPPRATPGTSSWMVPLTVPVGLLPAALGTVRCAMPSVSRTTPPPKERAALPTSMIRPLASLVTVRSPVRVWPKMVRLMPVPLKAKLVSAVGAVTSLTSRLSVPVKVTFGMFTAMVPEKPAVVPSAPKLRWPVPLVRVTSPPPKSTATPLRVTSRALGSAPPLTITALPTVNCWPAMVSSALVTLTRR